jgi:co-chaperonin GroES (HSP10)
MADEFTIKKPPSIFQRELKQAPAHPRGKRVLVRELPPESETKGGLAMAQQAIERLFAGVVVAAGDQAADIMYDGGDELGDLILYAKYAGVIEGWQHIVGPDDLKCEHDGAWHYVPKPDATLHSLGSKRDPAAERKWAHVLGGPNENTTLQECLACGTLICTSRVIVMSVDDMLLNVYAQKRFEAGILVRYRGQTAEGKTQHYIMRTEKRPEFGAGVEPRDQREAA